MTASSKAERLRVLHRAPPILVLPNAWDVVSAVLFARRGFPAVATTSASVAWTLGYPDGEIIPRDEMLAMVERIARAVDVPLTADLEAGYGDAGETARLAIEAGAAGLNLEDRLDPVDVHVERVRAAREAGNLVINARTDVFLGGSGDIDEAVERSNAYLAAGADCTYPIGVAAPDVIAGLVERIEGPVSVLGRPGMPSVEELERLGVARVSVGPWLARTALAAADSAAAALRESGGFEWAATPEADPNDLLA
jgi:2-methylisocitrate lyase-like PEP mutase family enzyme